MKEIIKPHFMKRVLAAFMDGALFAFMWLSISLFIMPLILNATMHTNDLTALGHNYQLASHLFVVMQERDDGGSDPLEF